MFYRYENLYIMHYGVGHDKGGHSGRYPWGSGEHPYSSLGKTPHEGGRLLMENTIGGKKINRFKRNKISKRLVDIEKSIDNDPMVLGKFAKPLIDKELNTSIKYASEKELSNAVRKVVKNNSSKLNDIIDEYRHKEHEKNIRLANEFIDLSKKNIDIRDLIEKDAKDNGYHDILNSYTNSKFDYSRYYGQKLNDNELYNELMEQIYTMYFD